MNRGCHLIGTARMGTDPDRSVVNEWGRCHDVKNLFIVDGSIWVTSGGVNPTSTIQALALYIADAIKQRLANLLVAWGASPGGRGQTPAGQASAALHALDHHLGQG